MFMFPQCVCAVKTKLAYVVVCEQMLVITLEIFVYRVQEMF